MLCGALPFEAQTTQALYVKILSGNIYFPSYVSSGAQSLIRRILTIDPSKRIKIPEIFQDEWLQKLYRNATGKDLVFEPEDLLNTKNGSTRALQLRTLYQMKKLDFNLNQTL